MENILQKRTRSMGYNFRIQRTELARRIGFGKGQYLETVGSYDNFHKHGLKEGRVLKSCMTGTQLRVINKGYPKGFTDYWTYNEKVEKLYRDSKCRHHYAEEIALPDEIEKSEGQVQKDSSKEPVDILLLTYMRLPFLKTVIRAIEERTNYPYRLIVIDNGSTDGTRWWIKRMCGGRIWKHVFNEKNIWISDAFAKGFKRVESRLFVETQDDRIPPKREPCWLTRLVELIDKHPEYATISIGGGGLGFTTGPSTYRKLMYRIVKKKCGTVLNVPCGELEAPNKGYPKDFKNYDTYDTKYRAKGHPISRHRFGHV